MRNPNRLYSFYGELMKLHIDFCPDMRFGQFFLCFSEWLEKKREKDIFYLEEHELIEYVKEFMFFALKSASV